MYVGGYVDGCVYVCGCVLLMGRLDVRVRVYFVDGRADVDGYTHAGLPCRRGDVMCTC